MKGLHPVAAFAIIIMVVLFLYEELFVYRALTPVTSVTKRSGQWGNGEAR